MITNDTFSHSERSGSPHFFGEDPFLRMDNALYVGAFAEGENIALVYSTAALNTTQAMLDMERNLFMDTNPPYPGRGHRLNILDANYNEVGIGQFNGTWTTGGKNYYGSTVTQDFGGRPNIAFITGVVYNDTVTNDNFFTVGEQTVGRLVDGSGASDTTGAGGGYELEYSTAGSKSVTFNLATGNVIVRLALGATNIKVDIVNGHELWTNASLSAVSTTATELHALGISGMTLTGSSAGEKIFGNNGANILNGGGGNDSLTGLGGIDKITGGAGHDTLTGGSGDDRFIYKLATDSGIDTARDIITDFQDSGLDRIDLSAVDPGTLVYQGTAAITGAHQVNVTTLGTSVLVHVNLDADATDEMQILLTNTTIASMAPGDFIL